jgi:integrase
VLEKRHLGKLHRVVLGDWPVLSVEEARRQRARELTWGELAALYLERHAPRKRSGDQDRWMLARYCGAWQQRRLSDIRRADIDAWHRHIDATAPYQANRVLGLVHTMFALAERWGLSAGPNPASGIARYREQRRDRFLSPAELARLWPALDAEPNPYVRTAILTLLLTGARRGEVCRMRWGDVDLERGVWTLPATATKAGRPHAVPLPAPLRQALARLPRQLANPYVFPGVRPGTHVDPSTLNVAWWRIRRRAASGANLSLIGRMLNHADASVTARVSAHLDLDPVRTALDGLAQHMLVLAGQEAAHG